MKAKKFETIIDAPAKKVWDVLWSDKTYRDWTSVFSEGSYAESDWNEGSKIYFLTPEGDGMYSIIEKKIPNKLMVFKHLGVLKAKKEVPLDEESKKWTGAKEIYDLVEEGKKTILTASVDLMADFEAFFAETFPKALERVKKLAEENN